MSNMTDILLQIEQGDAHAAEQLLPLVYDELRKLASAELAREKPGQTLQATALVHDAYLRLVGGEHDVRWNSRGHFFGAAAEAMRRILVENARRKKRLKRGGGLARQELNETNLAAPEVSDQLLALDEALDRLEASDTAGHEPTAWVRAGGRAVGDQRRGAAEAEYAADRFAGLTALGGGPAAQRSDPAAEAGPRRVGLDRDEDSARPRWSVRMANSRLPIKRLPWAVASGRSRYGICSAINSAA